MLGKRIRHLARYREIAYILIRNGFGWFITEIGLAHLLTVPRRVLIRDDRAREVRSPYERIRMAIEQLGPTFIKMGQVASMRTDLLPQELTEQLAKLHDHVPAMPFAVVEEIVEAELGRPLSDVFGEFSETAIGSASIGQVHRAQLRTGETVAVKVQRRDIQSNIAVDFEILADIVRLAERHFEWARHYELGEIVEEFRRTLQDECDYRIEARNAEKLHELFRQDRTVYIPQVNWDYTTSHVLVMEFVEGIKLDNHAALDQAGCNRKQVAVRICQAVFTQIFVHGFFHADPHPGNIAVLPGNGIVWMDFGMVGRLTPDLKRRLGALIIGLMRRNTALIVRALYRMGVVPADIDDRKLRQDVEQLRDRYYAVPLSQIHFGESIHDIFRVAYEHRIRIPADLSLVGKTLVTMEGVVENLDQDFRIMDIAESFGKRLIREQFHPKTLARSSVQSLVDGTDAMWDLPRQIRGLLSDLRRGRPRVQVDVPELSNLVQKMDRITNRMSFSVIILALSIFMAGLMIASSLTQPRVGILNLPFTDIGLVIGVLMVILLVWSIIRSGRL